jgi:hypothetical protein
VNGSASCGLEDLFAATEPIGDDQRVRLCSSHGGKKHTFSYGLRCCELLFRKAEWASHAAASGVERLQGGPHFSQQRLFVFHFHERFVMAMTVKHDFSIQSRWFIAGSMMFQKLTEQERLAPKPVGARISGEEVSQFIAEDRGAAWFENDDWQPGVDLRTQTLEDALEILLGFVEHAEVIQRAPAAEVVAGDSYLESSVGEYLQGGAADLRPVVVIEGVCPQNYFRTSGCRVLVG